MRVLAENYREPLNNIKLEEHVALTDTRLNRVRIARGGVHRVPEEVRKARIDARERLERCGVPERANAPALIRAETELEESSILSATRRAISRARPDDQGFATAQGPGIIPLKVAPKSIDRALRILTRFFVLAEIDGYRPQLSDTSLVLATEDLSIAFGLEEQPQKILHQPELKRRNANLRWGFSRPA